MILGSSGTLRLCPMKRILNRACRISQRLLKRLNICRARFGSRLAAGVMTRFLLMKNTRLIFTCVLLKRWRVHSISDYLLTKMFTEEKADSIVMACDLRKKLPGPYATRFLKIESPIQFILTLNIQMW